MINLRKPSKDNSGRQKHFRRQLPCGDGVQFSFAWQRLRDRSRSRRLRRPIDVWRFTL